MMRLPAPPQPTQPEHSPGNYGDHFPGQRTQTSAWEAGSEIQGTVPDDERNNNDHIITDTTARTKGQPRCDARAERP